MINEDNIMDNILTMDQRINLQILTELIIMGIIIIDIIIDDDVNIDKNYYDIICQH